MTDARRYLLGQMMADDETRYEETVLDDPARHEEVDLVAAELVDEYHAGTLPAAERAIVQSRLLATPQGRFRLRASRAIARRAAATPPAVRWKRWALFVAPAALAAAAIAIIVLRPPVPPAPERVSFALVQATRDAALPELVIVPGTRTVELQLPLAPTELATITSLVLVGPGRTRIVAVRTGGTVAVPAAELVPGTWELTIEGPDGPLAFLAFRVR